MSRLQALLDQIEQKSQEVNRLYNAMDPNEEPGTEHVKQIKDLNKTIEELEQKAQEAKEIEAGQKSNTDRLARFGQPLNPGVPFPGDGGSTGPGLVVPTKQYAQQFLDDRNIQTYLKSIMPTGRVPEKTHIASPPVSMQGMLKALITGVSDASAGALVQTDYKPLVDFPFRTLTMRDIITVGQTGSDVVEYPRVVSYTNNADRVAEATDVNTGEKPESDLVLEKVTANVETIAHWIAASTRALSDAGQIRTIIEKFLRYGLEEKLENMMLNANLTGFKGIYNTTGILTQAFATNIMTTTRKARTKLKVTGRTTPNAWVMHPNDWEEFDLSTDNEQRYYYGGPSIIGNPRLWGVPVVETEAATEDLPILGDFKRAVLWDREEATVSFSNSHADFFVKNLVAFLAELRAAFGATYAPSFITVDLVA